MYVPVSPDMLKIASGRINWLRHALPTALTLGKTETSVVDDLLTVADAEIAGLEVRAAVTDLDIVAETVIE
jgi:hypothetical protein